MLNFREYLGERIYRLTSDEQEDVHKVVDMYLRLFNKEILKKFIILKRHYLMAMSFIIIFTNLYLLFL